MIGDLSRFNNATTPRDNSPCGVTLDRTGPVLMQHVERAYDWVAAAGIEVPEVLLVPLFVGRTEPVGTLWIVSNRPGHFHSGHARVAAELASFVGTVLRVQRTEEDLKRALEAQETLSREMSHRVKNLFALVNTMIRFGARSARDKDDFSQTLTGRMLALASAHEMVMTKDKVDAADLDHVIRSIIEPHQHEAGTRFVLDGATMAVRPQSISGLALVINELATNAIKYGALASEQGQVVISWNADDETLNVRWEERGGAAIDAIPERIGFGVAVGDCRRGDRRRTETAVPGGDCRVGGGIEIGPAPGGWTGGCGARSPGRVRARGAGSGESGFGRRHPRGVAGAAASPALRCR